MRRVFLLLLITYVFSVDIFAGNTGKLYGIVKDKATGELLIGANVVVLGTSLGAATDDEGFYYITKILPGTYSVQISMIGYQSITYEQVQIMADVSTEINCEISPATLSLESIIVVAQKPIVQKDRTSSKVVVEGATITEEMRAQSISEVLQLQAGITVGTDGAFHVRGGRSGGTVYQVDGIPLTNPFTHSRGGDLEVENIQELQALLGTFDAEYGNAGDAVVTVVTKDGGDDFKVKFTYESSQLNESPYHQKDWNLTRDDIKSLTAEQQLKYLDYVRKADGTSAYDFVSVIDDPYAKKYIDLKMLGTMSLNLSGTVPFIPKLKYVLTGRLRNRDSQLTFGYGLYRYASLKLTYKFSPTFTIRGSYDWTQDIHQDHDFAYKYWRYWDSGEDAFGRTGSYPIDKDFSNRQILSMRHVLSKDTYYDVSLARVYDYTSSSVPDRTVVFNPETGELIYTDYIAREYVDGNDSNFRYGDVRYWTRTRNTQYIAKGNLESQLDNHHQLRTGFEFKSHELLRHRIGMPPSANLQFFTVKPVEFSSYIQDKIEYSFMILKLGLRFDYFDPKASEYPDISKILYVYTDANEGTSEYLATEKKEVSPHMQFSPRIGIAHPISDKTSLHFAYGHFFQIPQFYDLYRSDALPDVLKSDALIGNPGLKPEKTVTYEVGLQQELTKDWGLNITAYSKDIYDLTSTYYYFEEGRGYTVYTNLDYARVQGIDLSVNKSFSDNYSLSVNYTLMYAEGNASDPDDGYSYREEDAALRPNKNFPLDFDQRHKVSTVLTVRSSENFGPEIFGVYPFENWAMTGIFTAGSGLPYTPSSRDEDESDIVPEPNSARRPWTVNFDLKLSRKIKIDKLTLTAFVDAENLFDIINTKYIWSRTGEPWDEGSTSVRPEDRQANPANVGSRRSVKAGISIEF